MQRERPRPADRCLSRLRWLRQPTAMAFQVEPGLSELTLQTAGSDFGERGTERKSAASRRHRLFSAGFCPTQIQAVLTGHTAPLPGPRRIQILPGRAWASLDPSQPTGLSPAGAETSLSFLASLSPPAFCGSVLKRKD